MSSARRGRRLWVVTTCRGWWRRSSSKRTRRRLESSSTSTLTRRHLGCTRPLSYLTRLCRQESCGLSRCSDLEMKYEGKRCFTRFTFTTYLVFTTRSARSIGACDNSCMLHGMPVPAYSRRTIDSHPHFRFLHDQCPMLAARHFMHFELQLVVLCAVSPRPPAAILRGQLGRRALASAVR